ncbi:MAG TPA: hypothetical protein VHK05_04375 [Candidatus Limnocylindrales bacterium]|nr:hypothetical protein [Candidatus Limnocylindrales bacterium]
MSFLRRLLGGAEPPPDWSPFDDGRTHQAFIEAVEADLRRRGVLFEMGDGVVVIPTEGEDQPGEYGLSNLSQQCAASDEGDWSRIIATHFSSVFSIKGRDLDALAADYEQARPILRIRLMPDASMGGVEVPGSVVRAIAPGIQAVLVYDFPDSTASVHEEHLASWPVDPDSAFDQALANLDKEPAPLTDDMEVEVGTSVRVWYGDSFYVATRLLRLAELLPPGTTDALVAVPNRHTLLVHAIVDGGAVAAMQPIYRLAAQLFREGPGSISDQPYWWHDGALEQIPHHAKGSNVTVVPPDGLLAVFEAVIARTEGG